MIKHFRPEATECDTMNRMFIAYAVNKTKRKHSNPKYCANFLVRWNTNTIRNFEKKTTEVVHYFSAQLFPLL